MNKPEHFKLSLKKNDSGKENTKKIDDYIINSLDKGYKQEQIKTALAIKGWTKSEIDEAFKRTK